MPRAHLLVWTLAALLVATPLAAQHITSPYRYLDSPQAATLFAGVLRTQTGTLGVGPESGTIFGGRFGYRASGPLVLELTIAYAPLDRQVRDTVRTSARDSSFRSFGTASQRVILALAGLRFDITGAKTWHGLQPYVAAGVGGAIGGSASGGPAIPEDLRFKFGTSFALQAGGGIEWYATRHVGVRADARGLLWKLHSPVAFRSVDLTLPASEWAQNLALTGGIAIHF